MPTRTAKTAWTGTLQEGSGQVEMTSSGVGTYAVSFPKRAADDAGGTTSPEELIAAAHSACYAMSLSNEVGQAGGTPRTLDVKADVSLGPDPAGGFRLTLASARRIGMAHPRGVPDRSTRTTPTPPAQPPPANRERGSRPPQQG